MSRHPLGVLIAVCACAAPVHAQDAAARKELDTLAKLGAKFDDQAEVARLMRGL